jgi:outer membrane immunogenic protein
MRGIRLLKLALLLISPSAQAADWTGFYMRAQAGYGWQSSFVSYATPLAAFQANIDNGHYPQVTSDSAGPMGGLHAGYNFQFARQWFAGFEADISASAMRGTDRLLNSDPAPLHSYVKTSLDWFATARGRLGFLPSENMAVFVTGGLAAARARLSASVVAATATECSPAVGGACGDVSETKTGWTLGGGATWKLDRNWAVKAEYLYYDLGSIQTDMQTPTGVTLLTATAQFRGNVVRGGLSYQF